MHTFNSTRVINVHCSFKTFSTVSLWIIRSNKRAESSPSRWQQETVLFRESVTVYNRKVSRHFSWTPILGESCLERCLITAFVFCWVYLFIARDQQRRRYTVKYNTENGHEDNSTASQYRSVYKSEESYLFVCRAGSAPSLHNPNARARGGSQATLFRSLAYTG